MLFEYRGDVLLQDECNRTSKDDMKTEVNSCRLQLRVLAGFAVSLEFEDLIVFIRRVAGQRACSSNRKEMFCCRMTATGHGKTI